MKMPVCGLRRQGFVNGLEEEEEELPEEDVAVSDVCASGRQAGDPSVGCRYRLISANSAGGEGGREREQRDGGRRAAITGSDAEWLARMVMVENCVTRSQPQGGRGGGPQTPLLPPPPLLGNLYMSPS